MRNKSTGRDCDPDPFVQRTPTTFQINANSNPNKVSRWLRRAGGAPLVRPLDKIAAAHIHPRYLRRRLA